MSHTITTSTPLSSYSHARSLSFKRRGAYYLTHKPHLLSKIQTPPRHLLPLEHHCIHSSIPPKNHREEELKTPKNPSKSQGDKQINQPTKQAATMSKDCGNHGDDDLRQACRRLLTILLVLAIIVGIIALIVYLVLRPTHPRFFLQDASLRQLDLSNSSGLLSTSIQVTIASRNPNDRVGVYYDRLDVYASYKYQQITVASSLPPVYQGHGDVDVWSPILDGPNIPFAPYLAEALSQDCQTGYLILQIKIDGRVRWKVGSWISGHYHLFVTCPAFLITNGGNGAPGANGFRFQTTTYCHVEV